MDKNWTANKKCQDDEIELRQEEINLRNLEEAFRKLKLEAKDDTKFDCVKDPNDKNPPSPACALSKKPRGTSSNVGQPSSELGEATNYFDGNQETITRAALQKKVLRLRILNYQFLKRKDSPVTLNPLCKNKLSFATPVTHVSKKERGFCFKIPRSINIKKTVRLSMKDLRKNLSQRGRNNLELLFKLLLIEALGDQTRPKEVSV